MATYYVSPYGADANAGTGPLATQAWLTLGKLLGAAGMASGDTAYICPGVYRENVTVAMTSATVTTSVIGDPGNVQGFKDANSVLIPGGEIQWTGAATNNWVQTGIPLNLANRDFLSFQFIVFVGNGNTVTATSATSVNLTFTDCAFLELGGATNNISYVGLVDAASNLTLSRCLFFGGNANAGAGGGIVLISLPTSTTADYNAVISIQNCVFIGGGNAAIMVVGSGANAFKGGGASIYNCTFLTTTRAVRVNDVNISSSFPINVYNSACVALNVGVQAATLGQIIEDYNLIQAQTTRTNVAVGTHSVANFYTALFHFGQEQIWGGLPRPFGMPTVDSPLIGVGAQASGPTVDFLGRGRASGVSLLSFGTATSGAARTITDTAKAWGTNQFKGYTVQITGGTGSGQTKSITSNTATALTVDGNWKTNPNNTSTYQVYWGDLSSTGTATAGSTTTMTDGNAAWGVNQWTGYILSFDTGTGSPQTATVTSNTATVITFPIATAPDATTTYSLYRATGITTQDYAVGAYERQDSAQKETTTTDAGGVGIAVTGQGSHEFNIPVDATATTISVRCSWDTAHGNGSKPQATLLANGEISVTTETVTAAGTSPTWETLTFATQTPTAKGIVTVRLISRSAVSNGRAFFDTFGVA